MKATFILCKDRIEYTKEMTTEDKAQLFDAILYYNNDQPIWEELSYVVKVVFSKMKNFFDEQNHKYEEKIVKRNKENGAKGGRPPSKKPKKPTGLKWNPDKPKETLTDTDTITVENKNNKKNNTLTSITKPNGFENVQDEDFWSSEINDLILELKETASQIWIAYDAKDERNFWKHICSAREFWAFASKIWQSRIEFSKNIMLASAKIWFWKWVCSWPKSIYQNYVEVYNLTLQKSAKQTKTSIPSFSSWIW